MNYELRIKKNTGRHVLSLSRGFTIIETMIAVSLFLVIVMIGMGALLNANLLHQKSQDMRSIFDNLSFVMEDMSRNLRTGYDYECLSTVPTSFGNPTRKDGTDCLGIAFVSTADLPVSNWGYFRDTNPSGKVGILKVIDGSTPFQITPDEVDIDPVSSFSVVGALLGDSKQPFVTIKLVGTIDFKGVKTPFSLQTSVSQRLIDS